MFGVGTFSELGFSGTKDTETVLLGPLPIVYFNSSTLTFPLSINKLSDFDLKINTNQEHSLTINKMLNFTTRR